MIAGQRRGATVAAVLLALLAGGCDLPGGSAGRSTATPEPGSTDSWIVVTTGDPSPSPAARGARPTATPTPAPMRRRTTTTAGPTPPPRCTAISRPGALNGLTVVPRSGSATVTWYNAGDPSLVSYRLAAVPQRLAAGNQPTPDWRDIPAGAGCRTMTATVSGLTSGAPYIFWLDAVSARRTGAGTRDAAVARSGVVTID